MVPFIDVHSHLDFPDIFPRINQVVDNAKNAEVNIVLANGVDIPTNRTVINLGEKYDLIKPCLGFYPPDSLHREMNTEFKFNWEEFDEELIFIKKNRAKIAAIGEVGMDYKNVIDRNLQKKIFTELIRLSNSINKPLIVHSRQAEKDVIDILENENAKKVIMHCFNGKKSLIKRSADLNHSFSIPTNVVRSENIQNIVKMVPLSQLFCETDSPFLSPYKNKLNEPAFVIESYKKIAEIKKLTIEEVKNIIFMNYQKMF